MTETLRQYMSAPECAELAGIGPNTFTAYVNRGYAPAPVAVIGGRRYWDREEIRAWAKAKRAKRRKRAKRDLADSPAGQE